MTTGQRLQQLREQYGFSRYALERTSGVSKSHIRNVESDRCSPSLNTLKLLVDGLGVSLEDFVREIHEWPHLQGLAD